VFKEYNDSSNCVLHVLLVVMLKLKKHGCGEKHLQVDISKKCTFKKFSSNSKKEKKVENLAVFFEHEWKKQDCLQFSIRYQEIIQFFVVFKLLKILISMTKVTTKKFFFLDSVFSILHRHQYEFFLSWITTKKFSFLIAYRK
jgi:hypothetical protein